ncbi:MAG: DHH family phosphoesterase [Nitrospinaceae bacterium]|nr:MAG: DHH family phosphoesterase [Nitrospinaceae bacterium]
MKLIEKMSHSDCPTSQFFNPGTQNHRNYFHEPASVRTLIMKQKVPTPKDLWEGNLEQAASIIESHHTFLFSADIDPDSVGSMVSLSLYLRMLGKQVYLIISNSLGENLSFMEKMIEYNGIHTLRTPEEISWVKNTVDAVIFCDTANTKLVPFFPFIWEHLLSRAIPVIELDHHFGADSEKLADRGVTLFRKANATTEIIGELLKKLHKKHPDKPHPFNQRNIVISLLTGILGDTVGGRVVPNRQSYVQWVSSLGNKLKRNTRWRKPNGVRPGDDRKTKFGKPQQILEYLNRLSEEQKNCIKALKERMVVDKEVCSLNLLNSTYSEVQDVCRPYSSPWFAYILFFLLDQIPDTSGKLGLIYFHGKNADDRDCIYIKMRRASDYSGVDLRTTECQLRAVFGGKYMGGGGHPGAVSFRIHPHDENEFIAKFEQVVDGLKNNIV